MSYMYNTAAGVFLCKFDAPQITRYLYLFKFYTHTVCKHPHTRVRIFRGLKSRFYEIARRITARGEHSDEISRRTTFYINADESIKEREHFCCLFLSSASLARRLICFEVLKSKPRFSGVETRGAKTAKLFRDRCDRRQRTADCVMKCYISGR